MGITTDQQLRSIADEFVEHERRERAFEKALFDMCRDGTRCERSPCKPSANYHAEYCGCASEARNRFKAAMAQTQRPIPQTQE